jgi:hypothetical protein
MSICKNFALGGVLSFPKAKPLSGVSVHTPVGVVSAANRNKLVYSDYTSVKASDSVGKAFYFYRAGEGLEEMTKSLELLQRMGMRPALFSEAYAIATLPFSLIREAAIQTEAKHHGTSFKMKVCLRCLGSDMLIDGLALSPLLVCDRDEVRVNAIRKDNPVHSRNCIPVIPFG